MTGASPGCRHARLHIGGAPGELPPEVQAHLETCAECRRFRDETGALDTRLQAALQLPLSGFRAAAPRRSRFALAASVLLGLFLAGGVWMFKTPPALAGELVEHVTHEAASWDMHTQVPAAAVADVLHAAGVEFDTSLPVVYASACPFHGERIPHLVVQTADGPLTVMLLPHEKVSRRTEFAEHGIRGVLLPAGAGSVAVLARHGAVSEPVAREIVSAARW